MPNTPSLAGRLREWGERRLGDLALAWDGGAWSYGDLLRESRRRAAALTTAGVGPRSRVGVLQPNRAEWLACAFGVWQVGGILVPLNTLYQPGELAHALAHAEVEYLISQATFLKRDFRSIIAEIAPDHPAGDRRAGGAVGCTPHLRRVWFTGAADLSPDADWDHLVDQSAARSDTASIAASDDAGIFFTSGSSALPKAAVHTHASMLCAAENVGERLGLDRMDRTYGYLPLFFNGGLVGVALATLCRGGAVLLQDVFSAEGAIALMERHRCSVFFGWPHQAEAIARHPAFDRARIALRKGPGANAPWADSLLRDDHQCVGTWGMTETGPMAACSHHSDPLAVRRTSHGRAMPGLEIRIVDPQGRSLPAGESGEIAVRGTSLMRTYYGRSPLECFDDAGYFHTGDGGFLDDRGSLTFTGRLADIIKTAGVNVAAADVEAALLAHPDVAAAHVVPVPHATRGENVAAFVVTSAPPPAAEVLLDHCRRLLAPYKVPRHLFIVSAAELPLLGSGKVDRRALRARAAALASDSDRTE